MPADHYDTLATVYDWIVPEALTTPAGSVEAFLPYLEGVAPGARVLDCAAGTGPLAVGLALRGFDATATDASGAELDVRVCLWEDLGAQGFDPFDAVFCVGNSLAHAPGREARRAALRAMAGVMRPGALLVLTSRNFEQMRAEKFGLRVFDHVVVREGRRGVVIYSWWLGERWEDPHGFDVAVALVGDGGEVETLGERLHFWPFRHDELDDDLQEVGLLPEETTYEPDVGNYVVTARRPR